MFAFMKRVSRFEKQMDASMERFLFHHRIWGFFIVFIGMPMITLAAVCACTTIIALPFALMCGWI